MAASKWTAQQLPDLSGRTVVVTGASSGIGAVTAGELARAGARVVLAVRDVSKGDAAMAKMTGDTEVRSLDLTSLASISDFAARWTGDLDILINNAGIMMAPEGRTADGFELQIGTNHLGHFALTNLLLPHVTGRVVTITSDLHKIGKIDLDDLNWERRTYKPLGAYCQSKLANVLFTLELQRRLTKSGSTVRAFVAHPGVAHTNLINHVGGLKGRAEKLFLLPITQDVEHGALPSLFAATQEIPGGSYVGPDGLIHTKVTRKSSNRRRPPAIPISPSASGLPPLSSRAPVPSCQAPHSPRSRTKSRSPDERKKVQVQKRLVTRYATKSVEAAEENQRRIEAVFAELAAAKPENVSYLVVRLADNSFLHISFHDHGDKDVNPISSTPAFAHFQHDHADRREGPVDQQTAQLVGSYITTIG